MTDHQVAPGVTRNNSMGAYSWRTTDSEGSQVQLIWMVGHLGLMLSTKPSEPTDEGWSTPVRIDRAWSLPEASLEAAERAVLTFIREVAWK